MKTVFITISRGSLIRNFFHSGVVSRLLAAGMRVVVLTPNYNDPALFSAYAHERLILEPLHEPTRLRFHRLFLELFKGASFNSTIHSLYLYRIVGTTRPNRWYYLPRIFLFAPLSRIPGAKTFIRWLDFKMNPQPEHDYLFQKYKPDLVFATVCHEPSDVGVLKSARRFGVKSIQMPKSWDNPSKLLFNVKSHLMLVWGDYMKRQVVAYQGYQPQEVAVVGVPQFDLYARQELLLPREEFCRQLGLDPNKRFVLYGSSGVSHEHEAEYIAVLMEAVRSGRLRNLQVLARPHVGYRGDETQFLKLARAYPDVIVDQTNKQDARFKDYWDTSTGHSAHLFNSLHHADACVTIASTLSLDATACGTPVINLRFDAKSITDFAYAIERFYLPDFVRALTGTGATWVVRSAEEYVETLRRIIEEGERTPDSARAFMVREFMSATDGNAAKRIAEILVKEANF